MRRLPLALLIAVPTVDAAASAPSMSPAVRTMGRGADVVLISGLLGGLARLDPLAALLVSRGYRVTLVDPYRLGAGSADVSFHGLARLVDSALVASGVTHAVVVAHAHAASVALRLAVAAPARVHELVLLDGGALRSTRSYGVRRALETARWVAQLPAGTRLLRRAMAVGIRKNSGSELWLTDAVARQYSDSLLTRLPEVIRMANRLAVATEPNTLEDLLTSFRVPTLVLLGGIGHESGPDEDELRLLTQVSTVRLERVPGVGHFVHEEAPSLVVDVVNAAHARRTAAR